MDRLPWTKFHWSVIIGLGVSWILDGLEIQIVATAGYQHALHMSTAQVGLTGTIYLVGEVVGALYFGRLADKLGRKRLFILTLAIYLVGSGIAGLAPAMWFLWIFRFVAGLGIGGEYTAINSAIDELIPSHYRGRVDIAVNGTYWAGAAIGATANLFLLADPGFANSWGWRIGFFIGPFLGLIIIYLRRHIPESPRWLMTHGREKEAEETVDMIEAGIVADGHELDEVDDDLALEVIPIKSVPFRQVFHTFVRKYPRRTFLGLSMMITQSFLYNAIFFTYALVLQNFYHISLSGITFYFFPFALGNLAGPLILGPLFDTIGRRKMIFATYALSGIVLAVSAALFQAGALTALTQTIFWCVSFFFASAGASSAYLTVSEIFPLELRGQAISYFFAIGQAVGAFAPALYGALIGDGSSRGPLAAGYYLGAGVMIVGGFIALFFGINAERQSLESIADPLSKVQRPTGGTQEQTANR
ncbi:MFS transporter [Arthrobacter sp. ERGS1:01]|uniref:MFS transporter n=1 Tax=Arthrobacter sp. ERGS1:01 TaxID=1704044 RepID=UPI0006B65D52|nr:MFS transporter [Arthrobacter sp. ERGS1:01]ALE06219.1 MFS transporter [Arthrobacter sp. ERGS1:01]